MLRVRMDFDGRILGPLMAIAMLAPLGGADAAGFKQLYAFTGAPDGSAPYGALIADSAGNLYGTTAEGGTYGYGTVFRLAPDGKETVLYSFSGQADGGTPYAGLIADDAGDLIGTTWAGGDINCGSDSGYFFGCGTVFKVAPDGSETVLYAFEGGSDGDNPDSTLIADSLGNLYGTTANGGAGNGTVFEISPGGAETELYAFKGYPGDGAGPHAGLVADSKGNLYGTTEYGGSGACENFYAQGCGIVFKVTPGGAETILHSFNGGSADGANPAASLILDKRGNLTGTTAYGGSGACNTDGVAGCGIVFRIAPGGGETVLTTFEGGRDGANPQAAVIADKHGNLYGTTAFGGSKAGFGTVFRLAPDGKETVLDALSGRKGGANPYGSLLADTHGTLIGTTQAGGAKDAGDVFKVKE